MNKFTMQPAPQRLRRATSGAARNFPLGVLSSFLLQATLCYLAIQFVPQIGRVIGDLFGQVEQGLSITYIRI